MAIDRSEPRVTVGEWFPSKTQWAELMELVETVGQTNWVTFTAPFHASSHMLVASCGEEIAGYLRFVVQDIGPDMGCPAVTFKGEVLYEAKVLAFAVLPQFQRKGIGRALQQQALILARSLGCYQMRSHSGGSYRGNHELKLSLGFGVHPIVRGDDTRGAYFVLPLWAATRSLETIRNEGGALMTARRRHDDGNAPDRSKIVLLLIDVINDLEFEGGDKLLPHALEMAARIAALKRRVKDAGIPVIYVNDNFGQWRSDFKQTVRHLLEDGVRGEPIARLLQPDVDDYFVLKPKHSGFYSTTLATLLEYLGARSLILAGLTGDICVLFTANDAYMRDYKLYIPADCVASNTVERNQQGLDLMRRVLKADLAPSTELNLDELRQRS